MNGRQLADEALKSAGFRVAAEADGIAALDFAKREKPDLVLSDVMPRLDGFGLLAALREDPSLQRLPVLLLSARR
ncbi:MAG TPA: response regulator [Beijerinckiaceae bacterium]|nr:response regulator [Beijerinckiaceae bacterium]